MSDYSQTRSFNVGIAVEMSVAAALVYDDLVYAQKVFGDGYFFRSDEQMLKRFPMYSKNTLRRAVAALEAAGYLSTKVKKVNGKPTLNYQIEQFLLPKLGKTIEMPKMSNSLLVTKETTKKTDALLLDLISLVNPKEKPTADRVRVLNGRLKDYTPDEIRAAAVAFSKSEWHRENKQMSIDNLLAPSKFGRWYDQGVTDSGAVPLREQVTIENQDDMVAKRFG